jgi:hypothetical protein
VHHKVTRLDIKPNKIETAVPAAPFFPVTWLLLLSVADDPELLEEEEEEEEGKGTELEELGEALASGNESQRANLLSCTLLILSLTSWGALAVI